jgi:hypothetical protein
MERGNLSPRRRGSATGAVWPCGRGRARENSKQRNCEGLSTGAGHRGGPSRGSEEAR